MQLPAPFVRLLVVSSFIVALATAVSVRAAVTEEHKKEIAEIKKELTKVQSLIVKKQADEAEKALTNAEMKLKNVVKAAELKEGDKLVAAIFKQIEQKRLALGKKKGGGSGGDASFSKDVAPIVAARCLNCHGANDPKGSLRLDSYANMVQGGRSGLIAVEKNANASLLVQRITATDNTRMPRGGDPLKLAEIQKIVAWINQGAAFDGTDRAAAITDAASGAGPKLDSTPVAIAKATGNEQVSFTKDIAPFMANLCVGCHSGNNPRGAFSLETFEQLMRGGKSGRVVLPGNLEDSRLWHLVGMQDPIKMPPGQALITRKNHANLKIWIEEGAKYDGGDPKAKLRSLVPTEEEIRARELAALSPEEAARIRKERSEGQWKAAFPKDAAVVVESPEFIVFGNTTESRLKDISTAAEGEAKTLRSVFNYKGAQIWKGKLAIFVFKERFGYEEFTRVNEKLEVPAESTGHSKVAPSMEDAYICVQDIGDDEKEDSPGLRAALFSYLTGAYLQRAPRKIPDWVVRGTGLALAARANPKNTYFKGLTAAAANSIKSLSNPGEVFADGTFSSADIGPVGFTLVEHMLQVGGGEPKYIKFLDQLQTSGDLAAALRSVYAADTNALGASYVSSLGSGKTVKKKKK